MIYASGNRSIMAGIKLVNILHHVNDVLSVKDYWWTPVMIVLLHKFSVNI